MKTQLLSLIKFDFLLLYKYKVLGISIAVTLIYVAIFKVLGSFENSDKFLVLTIFNDPALLGVLFVGVMVIFEKNENTLTALAVTPIRPVDYILSKSIALTIVSLVSCFTMVGVGYRLDFNTFHFAFATIFSTLIFTMFGFVLVAKETSFNSYMLKTVGVILLLAIPFLGYFGILPDSLFWILPTQPCISLYDVAFGRVSSITEVLAYYSLCLIWLVISFVWAKRRITQTLFSS